MSVARYSIASDACQVDAQANANLSVIGDWARPKIALGGARGMPDASEIHFVIPMHSARQLVAAVDFSRPLRRDARWHLGCSQIWGCSAGCARTRYGSCVSVASAPRSRRFAHAPALPLPLPPDASESPEPDQNWLRVLDEVDPRGARDLDFAGGPSERRVLLSKIEAAELAAADHL